MIHIPNCFAANIEDAQRRQRARLASAGGVTMTVGEAIQAAAGHMIAAAERERMDEVFDALAVLIEADRAINNRKTT